MNLENSQVILESFRVIGLKDSDKEKLVSVYENKQKESSFAPTPDVVETIPVQDQAVIIEQTPEARVEAPAFVVPDMNQQVSEPVVNETVQNVVPEPQVTSYEQAPVSGNIFDQAMPSFDIPASQPQVTPVPEVSQAPVYEAPVMNEEVQGGTELDTPQTFFDRVEQDSNDTVLTKEMVEANNGYMSEDPAIIMIDNVRKIIEDKNQMINALNDKVGALEEQLRVSEEARKVSEAQRVAAESTLQAARTAEAQAVNPGGPTLTYQQPVYPQQNYQQAA